MINLNKVDLPAPESPVNKIFSPGLTAISGKVSFSPLGYCKAKSFVENATGVSSWPALTFSITVASLSTCFIKSCDDFIKLNA